MDPTRRTRDGIGARRTFPQWGRENEVRRCEENLPAMGGKGKRMGGKRMRRAFLEWGGVRRDYI